MIYDRNNKYFKILQKMKKSCSFFLAMVLSSIALVAQKKPDVSVTPAIQIIQIEPTVFFPKPADGQPLKQLIRIHIDNPGGPVSLIAKVTAGISGSDMQPIDNVVTGKSTVKARVISLIVGGNLKQALSLEWEEIEARRRQAWQLFLSLLNKENLALFLRPFTSSQRSFFREEWEGLLEILSSFCRICKGSR